MNNKRMWQIISLVLAAVVLVLLLPHVKSKPMATNFETCQELGGTLKDGEPVTCTYNGQTFEEEDHAEPEVILDSPKYGELVKSPLGVMGKARGTWFFEANIPVTLKDDKGNVLAQVGMQAIGDWMTTDYVNFAGTIPFDPGDAELGVLIINKDNPSGDPERDASIAVPVRFK